MKFVSHGGGVLGRRLKACDTPGEHSAKHFDLSRCDSCKHTGGRL